MILSHERFLEVLATLKGADGLGQEQRVHPRVMLRASVAIAPFSDAMYIDERCVDSRGHEAEPGPAFTVRVQDLGSGGIAIQHYNALPKGKLFVLELPINARIGESQRLLCRVQHCHMAGEHQFLIGAQFLRAWSAPAPTLDQVRAAA